MRVNCERSKRNDCERRKGEKRKQQNERAIFERDITNE